MLHWIRKSRVEISILLGALCFWMWTRTHNWVLGDPFLLTVEFRAPWVYEFVQWARRILNFTTPALFAYFMISGISTARARKNKVVTFGGKLPDYDEPGERGELYLTVGEMHKEKELGASENPTWVEIPEKGLVTGVAIIGATGSGKTSGIMYPAIEQLFGCWPHASEKRLAGMVLEVKGDLCHRVKATLDACGRSEDYVEIGLDSGWLYNPLASNISPYEIGFAVGSMIENAFGKSHEPFWRSAYSDAIAHAIIILRLADGYATFLDVYRLLTSQSLLKEKAIEAFKAVKGESFYLFTKETWTPRSKTLGKYGARWDDALQMYKAPSSEGLIQYLEKKDCPYELQYSGPEPDEMKNEILDSAIHWVYEDWLSLESKLRMSITKSCSVVLSILEDPRVRRIFCPSRKEYQASESKVLPAFSELIEAGKVCCLNFPVSVNPLLSRFVGVMCKLEFERSVLNRTIEMEKAPEKYYRHVVMMISEYQFFATVGGTSDPIGDDKFLSLSRQPKCIPIIDTQSVSSLVAALPDEASMRTILQLFRSKIFTTQSDPHSARFAADACGKEDRYRSSYTLSEHDQRVRIGGVNQRLMSNRPGVGASKSYQHSREYRFQESDFMALENDQAIALIYDGRVPHPATRVYLKPSYADRTQNYFEQRAAGVI